MRATAGSDGEERPRKTESASRCREGEDGAVNLNTAGPVRATLCSFTSITGAQIETEVFVSKSWNEKNVQGWLGCVPDSMRDDRFVLIVARMLPLRTSLIKPRDLQSS